MGTTYRREIHHEPKLIIAVLGSLLNDRQVVSLAAANGAAVYSQNSRPLLEIYQNTA